MKKILALLLSLALFVGMIPASYAVSAEDIEKLTVRVQNAGTEVVNAKAGAGSATLSMAAAAARFALSLVRAISGELGVVESAYVQGGSQYAPFFAQPVLFITTEQELEFDVSEGDSEIYLVVSGMSSMPLTVRFEEE